MLNLKTGLESIPIIKQTSARRLHSFEMLHVPDVDFAPWQDVSEDDLDNISGNGITGRYHRSVPVSSK